MINDATRQAFIDIHRDIHDVAAKTIARIPQAIGELVYPPNAKFTSDEIAALQNLELSEAAHSALQKLVVEASSTVMFQFFTLLDGVADPTTGKFDPWLGVLLVAKPDEDEPMLHDEFYESYWNYKKLRVSNFS
jgi:hypothetical protein